MPWAFKDLKADLARLLNQDLGDLHGKAAELEVRKVIDRTDLQDEKSDKFNWELWLVAGSGFFATGFSLAATNAMTPILELPTIDPFFGPAPTSSFAINTLKIMGMMIGQVVFGILSDVKGRTFTYGAELSIVICGTIGMATSSITFTPFWGMILGVGPGAEYPLSALIIAEWSSTRWRSFSMAAVLLMHSFGEVVASLTVFAISQALFPEEKRFHNVPNLAKRDDWYNATARDLFNVLDKTWRVAVFVGIALVLMAIIFRPLVPETPLWAATHLNLDKTRRGYAVFSTAPAEYNKEDLDDDNNTHEDNTRIQRVKAFLKGLRAHLFDQHRLWAFVGICIAWFAANYTFCLIDFGLYLPIPASNKTQPEIGHQTLSRVVFDTVYNLLYVSPGSFIGALFISALVDRVYRVRWMGWCFITLSAIYLGLLVLNLSVPKGVLSAVKLTVYGYPPLTLLSNVGPNTVLFILAAELFGTDYRGTLCGLAAATGKLGALVFQPVGVVLGTVSGFVGQVVQCSVYSSVLLVAALVTWAWIPETQVLEPRKRWLAVVPNRTLEDISEDPRRDQQLGLSQVWRRAFGLRPASMRQTGDQNIEKGPRDEYQDKHEHRNARGNPGAQEEEVEMSGISDGNGDPGWPLGNGGRGRIRDQRQHRDADGLLVSQGGWPELPELPEFPELVLVPAGIDHTWI